MSDQQRAARLELSPEEMRALGYRVVDLVVKHLRELPHRRVGYVARRSELAAILDESLPVDGDPPQAVLDQLFNQVLPHVIHVTHPRFFAFVPSPNNFVAVLADTLVATFNVFAGTWIESSGPAAVELKTLEWLRELCGLPPEAGGLFVSGGSLANLTALAVARHARLAGRREGARIYFSDQTHSSVERALRILGFQPDEIRKLPADDQGRLSPDLLRREIARDQTDGRVPFCVVANAGTTNTGAVDPLTDLAHLCRRAGLWFHVDGAYGAGAVISPQGKAQLQGLELADSLSLDPHKWLFQPYEIGCVLVRDRRLLRETFHILPEYLQDTRRDEEEINFCDYGPQLTRSFRALKLWMSLKVFGVNAFREAVEHGLHLARYAEGILQQMADWEVVTSAQLAIVTFRYAPDRSADEVDRLNRELVDALLRDGFAFLTSTELQGRTVLRLCTINPRTTEGDIQETLARLHRLVLSLAGGTGAGSPAASG